MSLKDPVKGTTKPTRVTTEPKKVIMLVHPDGKIEFPEARVVDKLGPGEHWEPKGGGTAASNCIRFVSVNPYYFIADGIVYAY